MKKLSNLAAATKKVEELRLQLLEAECEVLEAEALEVAEKLQKARKAVEQAARKSKERAKLVKEDVKCEVEKEKPQAKAAGDSLKGPVQRSWRYRPAGAQTNCRYFTRKRESRRARDLSPSDMDLSKLSDLLDSSDTVALASSQNKKQKTAETNTSVKDETSGTTQACSLTQCRNSRNAK